MKSMHLKGSTLFAAVPAAGFAQMARTNLTYREAGQLFAAMLVAAVAALPMVQASTRPAVLRHAMTPMQFMQHRTVEAVRPIAHATVVMKAAPTAPTGSLETLIRPLDEQGPMTVMPDATSTAWVFATPDRPLAKGPKKAWRQDLVRQAKALIGVPYTWGGNTPDEGLDCSGFVRYVYQEVTGRSLPRLSVQQSKVGQAVAVNDLHPGDLVFFDTERGPATHVGIFIGNGLFIAAPKTGSHIRLESLASTYWVERFNSARRVLA